MILDRFTNNLQSSDEGRKDPKLLVKTEYWLSVVNH